MKKKSVVFIFQLTISFASLQPTAQAFTCNATVDCLQIKDADGEPDERIVCHRGSCKPSPIRTQMNNIE